MKRSIEKSENDWEAVCVRCGRCCYEKVEFDGHIYYTEIPCQFLDTTSRLCRVYARRDSQRPGCVRLNRENIANGFLPADCPYVAAIENYPAPTLPDDDVEES